MSSADGYNVVSITDKTGAPILRSWRVTVQLPPPSPRDDSARVVGLLGVALVRAQHATAAAQFVRRIYPGADIFEVIPA